MKVLLSAILLLASSCLFAQQTQTFDINSLSPIEKLAHATVRIDCKLADGSESIGTGFIYAFTISGNRKAQVIITNKHVIAGAVQGVLSMTRQSASGGPDLGNIAHFEVGDFEKQWMPHPDPSVDLCVMPLNIILQQADNVHIRLFYTYLDDSLLPTPDDINDMIGLDEITMVGYPIGLWDEKNNMPIFRKGVMATNYALDWNAKPEFLIDAACFPGSSGSPVLLCDLDGFRTKKGVFLGAERIKLLGILHAGPQFSANGDIQIVEVPTAQKAISVTNTPINLGFVIKSSELRAFEVEIEKMIEQANPLMMSPATTN